PPRSTRFPYTTLFRSEDGSNELTELEERIKKTELSKEAREKAEAELKKLKSMSPMSAEATVVRNYLDWLLGVPWGAKSRTKKDRSEEHTSELQSRENL